MKTFATLSRHLATYLVGMLVAWFTVYLAGDDLKAATAAANALVEPLAVVAGFAAVIVTRLAMPFFNKLFRSGSGEDTNDGSGSGMVPMLAGLCMAAGILGALPSCSQSQEYPLTGTFYLRDPKTGAKAGLSYSPGTKLRGSLDVPIYDPNTGKQTGYAELATVNPSAK